MRRSRILTTVVRLLVTAALAAAGAATAFAVAGAAAGGSAGSLDSSFGGGGWSSAGSPSAVAGLAVQPDGKIVIAGSTAAGNFVVARLTANGLYDPSFGSGGQASVDFGGDDHADAVALQPDGKIVVAGLAVGASASSIMAVARLNPNGSLDTSFGSGGLTTPLFPGASDAVASRVAVEPDGKIVVGGYVSRSTVDSFAVARLLPDGRLDGSFGGGGWSSAGFPMVADALVVQPNGKILIAGPTQQGVDFGIARLTAGGVYDSSFGSGGQAAVNFGGVEEAFGLALQSDGRIVVAGSTATPGISSPQFAVTRLLPGGTVDPSFGVGGKVAFGTGTSYAQAVAVRTDGKIVVAGYTVTPGLDFEVALLNGDGSRDASFGTGGISVLDFGGDEVGGALALQTDEKIVVGGRTSRGGKNFLVARVLGNSPASTVTTKTLTTVTTTTTSTTVPTTTTATNTTTTAPKPALAARIVHATVTGAGRARRLVAQVRVSERASAGVRLLRNGFERVAKTVTVKPGPNTITMRIPRDLGASTCLMQIDLRDNRGNRRTYHATVRVPG